MGRLATGPGPARDPLADVVCEARGGVSHAACALSSEVAVLYSLKAQQAADRMISSGRCCWKVGSVFRFSRALTNNGSLVPEQVQVGL